MFFNGNLMQNQHRGGGRGTAKTTMQYTFNNGGMKYTVYSNNPGFNSFSFMNNFGNEGEEEEDDEEHLIFGALNRNRDRHRGNTNSNSHNRQQQHNHNQRQHNNIRRVNLPTIMTYLIQIVPLICVIIFFIIPYIFSRAPIMYINI